MLELPEKLANMADAFGLLPGVGKKSALRHALTAVKWPEEKLQMMANALSALKELKNCDLCGVYSDEKTCKICQTDSRLDAQQICVVEDIQGYLAIEKSATFKGVYFVLGGVLNPLLGIGPEELKVPKFVERCKDIEASSVVLAISSSVEGDATCSLIRDYLSDELPGTSVERLGQGIPMGGHLEHLDSLTISKAFEYKTLY